MTDREIVAEYLRLERAANRTPGGADVQGIIITVSAIAGRPIDDVRQLVRDATVMGAV